MITRSNFGDLMEPGFREIFDDAFKEVPMVMDRVFHVNNSTKMDERDSSVTGFGYLKLTGEAEVINYDDPIQGYDKVYTHLKFTGGFKVSREAWEDDQYNVFKKKPAALARAARRTAENEAAQVLNRGFNTSYLGGDGKPLFSVSHPRSDGGSSQSNASSTGITLTETNFETARLAMINQLDDRGMKIDMMADTVVVNPALGKTADIIFGSSGRSGTADNDKNVYQGKYTVVEWLYLSSTTAWFLMDRSAHELNWFWRIRPEFKQNEIFDTDVAAYKVRERFSAGWSDWRGVWGSKGDGLAYAS